MGIYTLKILQQTLQKFYCVSDYYETLCYERLRLELILNEAPKLIENNRNLCCSSILKNVILRKKSEILRKKSKNLKSRCCSYDVLITL